MKCLAIGDNCCDVYLNQNRYYPTGNAVDFAVNLKRLGGEVELLTAFGNDAFAMSVRELLARKGIPFSRSHELPRASAEALMNLVNGDRVHVRYVRNVLDDFVPTDADIEYARGFDIVYSERQSKFYLYADRIKHAGNRTVHDFTFRLEDELTDKILPHIDYAFFSYKGEDAYIKEFLPKAQAKGPRVVIAMLGPDGSMAFDGKRYHRVLARPATIVNTVGAGDSYIAGFTYGLMRGDDVAACMERGTEIATDIIQTFEPYRDPL